MSDTAGASSLSPRRKSDDEELLNELIFRQDLNEVHLLIDFISSRAERSLAALAMPDPEHPATTLHSADIVKRIMRMRYPPDDNPVVNSTNAAILLISKDKLSALASPARGLTIAYTTMFVDTEARGSVRLWFRSWRRAPDRRINRTGRPHPMTELSRDHSGNSAGAWRSEKKLSPNHDTRINLAIRTYPGLQSHARRFGIWRDVLSLFAVAWLVLTALTYWDAGLGRSVLQRLDENWKNRSATLLPAPELLDPRFCAPYETGDLKPHAAPSSDDQKTSDDVKRLAPACLKLWYLDESREEGVRELDRVFGCEGIYYSIPLHPWCWRWIMSGSFPPSSEAAKADQKAKVDHPPNAIGWQTATFILSVFTTYILPMMFALLGTLIGAFRAILNKARDSELAPRDFMRMRLGIPTGLVAGVAVGLFLSPSSVPAEGGGSIAGELTLTASGLGFLAGYGSHAFLRFLDDLLDRVFPRSLRTNAPTAKLAQS